MKYVVIVEGKNHTVEIYVEAINDAKAREKAIEVVKQKRLLNPETIEGTSATEVESGTLLHVNLKKSS